MFCDVDGRDQFARLDKRLRRVVVFENRKIVAVHI
jgi:hypothetical protein